MKAKISELMDGELEGAEAARALSALGKEGEGRQAWRTYHLISDALRDTGILSQGFATRVVARLADEPTVLAPATAPAAKPWRRYLMPAAAGVAAAAFVGLAFVGLLQEQSPAPQIAQVPQVRPQPASVAQEPIRVPLPVATDDYLLAHQGYSPRNIFQGVAPYVRTVSGQALEGKR